MTHIDTFFNSVFLVLMKNDSNLVERGGNKVRNDSGQMLLTAWASMRIAGAVNM